MNCWNNYAINQTKPIGRQYLRSQTDAKDQRAYSPTHYGYDRSAYTPNKL